MINIIIIIYYYYAADYDYFRSLLQLVAFFAICIDYCLLRMMGMSLLN